MGLSAEETRTLLLAATVDEVVEAAEEVNGAWRDLPSVLDQVAALFRPGPYCRLCGLSQPDWCTDHRTVRIQQ